MTVTAHALAPSVFDGLASGLGGPAAIDALRSAQLSKHKMLALYLLERWPGNPVARDTVVDALDRAKAHDPNAFAEVLSAPLVGAWAAIAARAASRGQTAEADFGHLAAVAVVACAAAGVDGEADVPIRDGLIAVPGMGAVVASATQEARLIATDGCLVVRAAESVIQVPRRAETETVDWLPVRTLASEASGQRIALGLDDLDPYRHGHHAPPANRLPAAEVDRWRRLFAEAWELLAERLPQRAAELTTGLRTLVPLQQTDQQTSKSATIRHAFGVFGLTRPTSATEFAVTLVHEFQHSKLSAILDLTPLTDPSDARTYFAPWRVDPRPLAGLLQGVYAFVGVADTWRALRSVDDLAPSAELHFAEARLQVDRGLDAVERSGALTDAGAAMAARLRCVTDEMLALPVPKTTVRLAERALEETRQRWLAHNGSAQ